MQNNLYPDNIPAATLQTWQEAVDILSEVGDMPVALITRLRDPWLEILVANQNRSHVYPPGRQEKWQGSRVYCETVINSGTRLLVGNALEDEAWRGSVNVRRGLISYLGYPLFTREGDPFGTICVLDHRQHQFPDEFINLIFDFRTRVQSDLALDREKQKQLVRIKPSRSGTSFAGGQGGLMPGAFLQV